MHGLGVGGLLIGALLSLTSCDRSRQADVRLDPAGQMLLDPLRDDGLKPLALISRMHLSTDATVADVGAGPGYLTLRLAAALPTGHVIATDLRADYLAVLLARAQRAGYKNVETRVATTEDSGLLPHSADLVILCQVDHYLRDRAAYFARLRTVLRPHGRIAVINYSRYQAADRAAAAAAGFRIYDEWSPSVVFFLMMLGDEDSQSPTIMSSPKIEIGQP